MQFFLKNVKKIKIKNVTPALQLRSSQWSITANLWSLPAHIYNVTIIVTSGFSKKSFLLLFYI